MPRMTFRLMVLMFIFLFSISARAAINDFNEMIDETLHDQTKTEAQLVGLLEENETIRGFYDNKRVAEFGLKSPPQIQLQIIKAVPDKEASTQKSNIDN